MAHVININGQDRNVEYVQFVVGSTQYAQYFTTESLLNSSYEDFIDTGHPDWPNVMAAVPNGLVIRPSQDQYYWMWDYTNNVWVVDYDVFNPLMFTEIKNYRDAKIASDSLTELEFNSEALGLQADARTLEAVQRKSTVATLVDDPLHEVNFKFSSFTETSGTDRGYRTVTTGFLQDFYKALDAKNQSFFDAERATLEAHDVTPFTTVEAAKAFFDGELL